MTTYTTTLAEPCLIDDDQISVASATGITDPGLNNTTPTTFKIDAEEMQVQVGYVDGKSLVPVVRGFNGTLAEAHFFGATVTICSDINFESGDSE